MLKKKSLGSIFLRIINSAFLAQIGPEQLSVRCQSVWMMDATWSRGANVIRLKGSIFLNVSKPNKTRR